MAVTRTLGPLHFEDLDPKRFEDLVRQLAYDFKRWRRLEATGRAGSDDGFDARGYEIVQELPPDGESEDQPDMVEGDRLWLIQCKRERSIPPAKLSSYLADIRLADGERLHGIVFTAACDFSKRSRDMFRQRCEELGIEEWHLWGKAELEDLLFQPRNDSLLFAYFGISLTIRRRNQKSELRSKLAMKRKAHRILEDKFHGQVLLRSPEACHYPYVEDAENFKKNPLWKLYNYKGMNHAGLLFCVRRHFAYLDDEHEQWDAVLSQNDGRPHHDPWDVSPNGWQLRQEIFEFWSNLPKNNQAWFEVHGIVSFESIIEIDEIGDDFVDAPHIYVQFNGRNGPFTGYQATVECADSYLGGKIYPQDVEDQRTLFFKPEWRKDSSKDSTE